MEHAFPFLSQFCSILGLEFQVVDMRWGVMDDTRFVVIFHLYFVFALSKFMA
jgi:hypothetical protein